MKAFKVIWWNEMEQEYTESIVEPEGVNFLLEVVGHDNIFSIEPFSGYERNLK